MYKIFINIFVCFLIVMLNGCANIPKLKIPTSTSKAGAKTEKVYVQREFKVSEKTATAYNAALKHMRTKNYATAIIEMKKVASMDERISGPWVNIGLAHKELGNKESAKASFEKALTINPKNPYALNHLAIIYRENGEFKKAEGHYKKALSARPDYQNAHLNLVRLGATADEYVPDMYGDSKSPLHAGLGTDRLVVRWALKSPAVCRRAEAGAGAAKLTAGEYLVVPDGAHTISWGIEEHVPAVKEVSVMADLPVLGVAVPADIDRLKGRSMQIAMEWRAATREVFHHYLEQGYAAAGFYRGDPVSHYVLRRAEGL